MVNVFDQRLSNLLNYLHVCLYQIALLLINLNCHFPNNQKTICYFGLEIRHTPSVNPSIKISTNSKTHM